MLLQITFIASWKEKTAYMMKIANDESYIIRAKNNIRVVDGSMLSDVPDAYFAFEIVQNGDNDYSFLYCDKYLSTKEKDPGIIVSEVDNWELHTLGNGYKIKSIKKDECLTKLESYDSRFLGNYMNRRSCESNLPNVFVFLEMGDIDFYCKQKPEEICKRKGFSLSNAIKNNQKLKHSVHDESSSSDYFHFGRKMYNFLSH